jgi:NADH-quinone oxidoreductase subunit C
VRERFPDAFEEATVFRDEMTIRVARPALRDVVDFLRLHPELRYNHLTDITAVDLLSLRERPRFDVVVHLYSIPRRQRLRVKCGVDDGEMVPSLVPIFAGANWLERECYDMFGIVFEGHPDLRRISYQRIGTRGTPCERIIRCAGTRTTCSPATRHRRLASAEPCGGQDMIDFSQRHR